MEVQEVHMEVQEESTEFSPQLMKQQSPKNIYINSKKKIGELPII